MENSIAIMPAARRRVGSRSQGTLRSAVELEGVGLHTGEVVHMRLVPAEVGHGVRFIYAGEEVRASVDAVTGTQRNTTVGKVYTVEHLMAAMRVMGVDNVRVELDAPEPPAMDGSSLPFMEAMERAGVTLQDELAEEIVVEAPVFVREGEATLVALPCDEFRISYMLHYPQVEAILSQFFELAVDCAAFREELAPCRTFARYDRVCALQEAGLIKGGSLENAVVVDGKRIINEGGLRRPNEMVRHKMLDLIGDLSLLGADLRAHVIAIGSGHRGNVALAKEIDGKCGL